MIFNDKSNILLEFENELKKNNLKSKTDNIKIAVDKVAEAAKIFDKYEFKSISNILLELLANIK